MIRNMFGILGDGYTQLNNNISLEYNAMDWPNFFLGGISTLYRGLTNGTQTKIENPALLVSVLTGKWTTLGKIINTFSSYFNLGKFAVDKLGRKKGEIFNAIPANIYYDLIVNYKSVDPTNYSQYAEEFKTFKELIHEIKAVKCTPCVWRPVSTTEISGLKLFKPEKAENELRTAANYLNQLNPKFGALVMDVAKFVKEEIIEFILRNTRLDV